MEKHIEEQVADAILEKPFELEIPTLGLLRLLGKKTITLRVKPLRWGTKVKISGKLHKLVSPDKESVENRPVRTGFELVNKNARPMCLMIAYAILNSPYKFFLSRPLAWYLYWHLDSSTAFSVMIGVVKHANIKDFMSTIVFLNGLSETAPKNQETSPIGTRETIARTESSPKP